VKHRFGATVRLLDPDDIEEKLEKRLGHLHARQRLGIEMDHEAQVFGQGLNFFHIENLLFSPAVPRESPDQLHAPYTPVAACPVIRRLAGSSQEIETPLRVAHVAGFDVDKAMAAIRKHAPGFDAQMILREWEEWSADKPEPENQIGALVNFTKRK
jgi:hypothetical protein